MMQSAMSSTITAADVESLCGRPAAFARFTAQLLHTLPEHRHAEALELGRFGRASLDRATKTAWWAWPWARSGIDAIEGRLLRWLGSNDEVRLLLARAPSPGEIEQLGDVLRRETGRAELRVRVHGPDELARWCLGAEAAIDVDHVRLPRALAARAYEYSDCERALITALDQGADASEHWAVVADELLRRGDPVGESLALALAARTERRFHRPTLQHALVDREALRMATADRHARLLAFVDMHGRSFDVCGFMPAEAEPPEPDRYEVQLWADRVGPFFVRLLARTNYDEWRGLGLPEALLSAPELRYLSPTRMSSIHHECAELSNRDLSGFDFSGLSATGQPVYAYEASLRRCNLRQADLSHWQLDGADLRGAEADLDTRFGDASFIAARVGPALERLLQSWNAGRYRRRGNRSNATANVHELLVVSE